MGKARVITLVTLRKCTLSFKREIKILKLVLASMKGFKGGLASMKPSKKDVARTFSYFSPWQMEGVKGKGCCAKNCSQGTVGPL